MIICMAAAKKMLYSLFFLLKIIELSHRIHATITIMLYIITITGKGMNCYDRHIK